MGVILAILVVVIRPLLRVGLVEDNTHHPGLALIQQPQGFAHRAHSREITADDEERGVRLGGERGHVVTGEDRAAVDHHVVVALTEL